MGSFALKEKVRKVGVKETPVDRSVLKIGRAGENDVVIDDPLVSPSHCRLEWIGGQCRLSDTGSVSGTYVDGQPIDEFFVLRDGQTITIGLNEVKIDIDPQREVCGIFVEENVGTGEKQLHREIHITVRPWYQQPKWYALVGLAATAVAVGALTVAGATGIYQNGPLAAPHTQALADAGRASDCSACHTPFRGVATQKCADCHDDKVGAGSTHPMGPAMREAIRARRSEAEVGRARGTDKGTTALASFEDLEDLTCFACHGEHRGVEVGAGLSPWKDAHAPRSIPPATCRGCHQDAHAEGSAPGSAAAAGSRVKEVRFDAFSHADHAKQGVVKCETCHVANRQPTGPDFGPAGYASCLPCHEAQRVPSQGLAEHGRDAMQMCARCHQSAEQPKALKLVTEMPAALPALKFGAQHHDRDRRCSDCHADLRSDLPALSQGKPFDHYYHASSLAPDPAQPGVVARAASQCAGCHAGIVIADSVEASKAVPDLAGCRTCHTAVDLLPGAPPPHPRAEAREAVVFAHKDHVARGRLGSPGFDTVPAERQLSAGAQRLNEQSCFACHAFAADAPGARLPSIAATAADCRGCHLAGEGATHVDAGLQRCDYCHTGTESVYGRAPREQRLQQRPGSQPYDHHLDTIDGAKVHEHATVKCETCHGEVLGAATVSQIRFPEFTDKACQSCHGNLSTALGDLDCAGCHGFHLDPQTSKAK